MFGWFRRSQKVEIVVKLEVSGSLRLDGEDIKRLPDSEGYISSRDRDSSPSDSESKESSQSTRATPDISVDFFADGPAPEAGFGEEVA